MKKQIPLIEGDTDYIATITLAYVRKKKAVLVFCPTRDGCQKMAKFIANKLPVQFAEYKKVPASASKKSASGRESSSAVAP